MPTFPSEVPHAAGN